MKPSTLARQLGVPAIFTAMLFVAAPVQAQQQAAAPAGENIVTGYTSKPYVSAQPGVNLFGTVLERPVQEGQAVKKGDILLRQDDREERAVLEALELEANSTVRIEAAEADLKVKQAQLKRYQQMPAGVAAPVELEKAEVEVVYADAQVKIAKLELEKNKREAERQRYKVERMTIKSPVDGFVERIDVTVGDVTDPQKPVMTIVQNDPLKIEFFIATPASQKLKVGQELHVRYAGEEAWIPAKVIFKSPVAETASDTQKVGLEMKNSDNRDAGLQVQVKLPTDLALTPAASPAPGEKSAQADGAR